MIQYKNGAITVFESALYQTTSTVVETDDLVLVVDPNWLQQEVEAIRSYVSQIRRGRPLYLLLTHSDFDHIIGYGAFPGAQVIASREFHEHPHKEHMVAQCTRFDSRNYIRRSYPHAFPAVDHIIEHDEQQLGIGGTTLTFYKSPGHMFDSLFTLIDSLGLFLAGDYLSDVEFPYINDDTDKYIQTMHKAADILQRHPVQLLVPGHGQSTTDRAEMKNRCQQALNYIEEGRRLLRENQVEAFDAMINRYAFPDTMNFYHEENKKRFLQEMKPELSS